MKKIITSAIVGGIIIFCWQLLSYNVLHIHNAVQKYTPAQDSMLIYLNSQLHEDGQYLLPTVSEGASYKDKNKASNFAEGRPWASISFHKSWQQDIIVNVAYGLLINILMIGFLSWIFHKMPGWGLFTFFLSTLFIGLIVFLNTSLTSRVWYQSFGLTADLIDAVVGWGLVGIWMGGYLGVKPNK
jgi:hypothetical protein